MILYRQCALAIAIFYVVYVTVTSEWTGILGPYAYLTIWSLVFSVASFWWMLRHATQGGPRYDAFVVANTVVAGMVVFLFWRLYFEDPTSVTRNGELQSWFREAYLHGIGPALLWIDALFVHRAFGRRSWSLAVLLGLVAGYLTFTEVIVEPLHTEPVGSVTNGLPYPFLNNMEFAARLEFYGVNIVFALVLLAALYGVGLVVRRFCRE